MNEPGRRSCDVTKLISCKSHDDTQRRGDVSVAGLTPHRLTLSRSLYKNVLRLAQIYVKPRRLKIISVLKADLHRWRRIRDCGFGKHVFLKYLASFGTRVVVMSVAASTADIQ